MNVDTLIIEIERRLDCRILLSRVTQKNDQVKILK